MADTPIACDLGALSPVERERRAALFERLRGAGREIVEETDGLSVRVDESRLPAADLLELLAFERRCCPFFRLAMRFEPDSGPLWVTFAGGPRVKEFLRSTDAFARTCC